MQVLRLGKLAYKPRPHYFCFKMIFQMKTMEFENIASADHFAHKNMCIALRFYTIHMQLTSIF